MAISTLLPMLAPFKKELTDLFNDQKDEIKHLIDDGLQEYIVNQHSKIARVKTFIYRSEPIEFYQTFFPLDLLGTTPDGTEYALPIKTEIKNIFANSQYVSILGDAGSGKSMLIKHIFLSFLQQEQEIPLYIELRSLNLFDGSFQDYIKQTIFNNRLTPNDKILERMLSSGKFLFLLDGYDELHSTTKHKRKDEISQFIDKYRKNYYLITSRPGAYLESLPRFCNYRVAPIQTGQIEPFISKQLSIIEDSETWIPRMMEVITEPKNKDYKEYMANPLLLSMFIFTFRNHPEMPHTKSKFYFYVFDTLCTRHDTLSKSGELHERKTRLKSEDFEKILEHFSYTSYFEGKYSFERDYLIKQLNQIKNKLGYDIDTEDLIYDLTVSIAIITIDGTEYKFPHRSLQEYFAARLISRQPEETKLKIYQKRYIDDRYSSWNIWTLSQELDAYCFKKVLLQNIQECLTHTHARSIKQKVINFSHITGIYWRSHGAFTYTEKYLDCYCYWQDDNINMLDFEIEKSLLEMLDDMEPIQHLESMSYDDKTNTECNKIYRLKFYHYMSTQSYNFFRKIGLVKKVQEIIEDMKRVENRLQADIEREENLSKDLLDF